MLEDCEESSVELDSELNLIVFSDSKEKAMNFHHNLKKISFFCTSVKQIDSPD